MAKVPAPPAARVEGIRLRDLSAGALLFLATLLAYAPSLRGGLVWDDVGHVTRPALQSPHGLWRIWFELGATQQYYPLLHSAFWVEHRLWGDAILGYHLTNVALHAAAACLVVAILRRLSIPGSWLAGFIFALHPVCVESVAWISEQKTTLSTVLYLASALTYLHFDQKRGKPLYLAASGLFALALLSKTVTATLPLALLVVFWWLRGRLGWKRDAWPLLPWIGVGAAAGLFTAWVERTFIGATGPDFALPPAGRLLVAGRAIWYDMAHVAWPANLMFTYPRWRVDPAAAWQYLFPLGALALAAALWRVARHHRGPLAGFLYFAGTLFPTLGFLNAYPFVYSYVADHFQYLADLGLIAPAAAGLTIAARRIPVRAKQAAPALAGVLLLGLGVLTWGQSRMYRDEETLWRTTLERNPESWMAHNNLGILVWKRPDGNAQAMDHFEAALRIKPDYAPTHINLGTALAKLPGRSREAIAEFRSAVALMPNDAEAHLGLGSMLAHIPGQEREAMREYRTALRLKPEYAEAHISLGADLAEIPGQLRNAIAEYQEALRIDPNSADAYFNLGNALLKLPERLPDAIAAYRAAIRIQPDRANAHLNLAGALTRMPGRGEDAAAECRIALRINPDYAEAHYSLGTLLSDIPGRSREAIDEYRAALRIKPEYAEAHTNLGVSLADAGRLRDAISEYEAALQTAPDFMEAHFNLGNALARVPGRMPEAMKHYETALRLRPDSQVVRETVRRLRAVSKR